MLGNIAGNSNSSTILVALRVMFCEILNHLQERNEVKN